MKVETPRAPLSRDRVLETAIRLADRQGIEAVTMRQLAAELGVEAMSIYYHIANKHALLDGVVDALVTEIEDELGGFGVEKARPDWLPVLRHRILTARRVMLRHRWAPTLIQTRASMTPALLRYFDSLLGILVEGGFTYDQAHHALHALGSRALGFSPELFEPDAATANEDDTAAMMNDLAPSLPYLMGMMAAVAHDDPDTTLGWCDDQTEFEFGLDLLLEGLERHRIAP